MIKMSLKEIQDVNLEILEHIDSFCREKGITYFLDSGTLLGAARNGGFIPWDDDADIVMPRPDYERFVKEYVDSDEYRLYAPLKDNCFLPYARLCEMKRTYFMPVAIWTREDPGVGVDIIPLDGAPNSVKEFDKLDAKIVKLRNRIWLLRDIISSRKISFFKNNILGAVKACIYYIIIKIQSVSPEVLIRQYLREIRKLRLQYPYESSNYCFYIVVKSGRRRWWRKEWFKSQTYLDFCGKKFPVPIGWDERLSAEYGDWRTPPPETDRQGHITCQTMYWRNK